MIPRYQRILFWSLAAGIFLMAAFLVHGCQQAQKRLTALNDATPIAAPTTANTEDVTFTSPTTPTPPSPPLPNPSPSRRSPPSAPAPSSTASSPPTPLPTSAHPLQSGPAVDDVFLLSDPKQTDSQKANQLAVINLRSSFIDNHPSGILVEALTLQSIIGTLHAALPEVTTIRFLVDGQPHDTLAGHADLLRTYPATDTTTHPNPPTGTQ